MVKCVYCEHENADNERLCIKCGLPVTIGTREEHEEWLAKNPDATQRLNGMKDRIDLAQWRPPRRLDAGRKVSLRLRGFDDPINLPLVDKKRVVLGRYDSETHEAPDINLSAYNARDMGVSRRHAAVSMDGGLLKIVDLGSANATYVNSQKLIAHQSRILQDGDEVRLGNLTLVVHFAD